MKARRYVPLLVIIACLLGAAHIVTQVPLLPSQAGAEITGRAGANAPQAAQMTNASTEQRTAAIRSIVAQLDAFKQGDYERAARYQSPALRQSFGSIQRFQGAIQRGYPEFAHYDQAEFGPARASLDGEYVAIPVKLTGADGRTVAGVYEMLRDRDGIYRVRGVDTRPAAPTTPAADALSRIPIRTT